MDWLLNRSLYTGHFVYPALVAIARRLIQILLVPWRAIVQLGQAALFFCIASHAASAVAALQPQSADFSQMSIEDLGNIEISSVSRKKEPLSDAAAAIYVITSEDIRRSGATSIPEALRLAPNLQVARVDASQYAITARGFNSTTANKLQVLIDGRSVYTPLFSGVFWDVQDVFLEDIDRIEVISGPGGTIWGSNAVNGVINIITRSSRDTQGTLLSVGAGTLERGGGARYGGKVGDDTTFRLYAKGFDRDHTETSSGADVHDSWSKQQAGFRVDSANANDGFTLQGDIYDGSIDQSVNSDKTISGANMLGRWNRALAGGANIQVQAYYDKTRRVYPGTFSEDLDTYDIDAQHQFQWGENHDIVWGGGYRLMQDHVGNTAALAFLPGNRSLSLANLFAQDTIALNPHLKLTLGAKVEHNSYTGLEFQPNARLAWKLNDRSLLWSAISRAVRTPSRIDAEFFVPGTAPFLLVGNPDFKSEKLTAYEVGYRAEPASNVSFSISTFYNVYDDLRSIELSPGGGFPFVLGNKMKGDTYGVEMWGSYRVNDWWKLSAGYNFLKKELSLQPGSSDTTSLAGSDTDSEHQFSLRSAMDLPHNVELDIALRTVSGFGSLSSRVPHYTALDARIGWLVAKGVEVSLTGVNLLDPHHLEFDNVPSPRSELDRSVYLKMVWSF